ncbi:hypothetical protein BH18ACT16_BH18ACT16_06530 [soil metagenome]
MSLDRRTFIKAGLVVPVAASLPGGLAALTETAPVVTPALKTSNSTICGGSWRGLPVGWARFTDFSIACPPLGHEVGWNDVCDTEHNSVEEFLTKTGLTPEQRAHAAGSCSHAKDMDDIVAQNLAFWRSKRGQDSFFEALPLTLGTCSCNTGRECEWCAEIWYHPDNGLRVHEAG